MSHYLKTIYPGGKIGGDGYYAHTTNLNYMKARALVGTLSTSKGAKIAKHFDEIIKKQKDREQQLLKELGVKSAGAINDKIKLSSYTLLRDYISEVGGALTNVAGAKVEEKQMIDAIKDIEKQLQTAVNVAQRKMNIAKMETTTSGYVDNNGIINYNRIINELKEGAAKKTTKEKNITKSDFIAAMNRALFRLYGYEGEGYVYEILEAQAISGALGGGKAKVEMPKGVPKADIIIFMKKSGLDATFTQSIGLQIKNYRFYPSTAHVRRFTLHSPTIHSLGEMLAKSQMPTEQARLTTWYLVNSKVRSKETVAPGGGRYKTAEQVPLVKKYAHADLIEIKKILARSMQHLLGSSIVDPLGGEVDVFPEAQGQVDFFIIPGKLVAPASAIMEHVKKHLNSAISVNMESYSPSVPIQERYLSKVKSRDNQEVRRIGVQHGQEVASAKIHIKLRIKTDDFMSMMK